MAKKAKLLIKLASWILVTFIALLVILFVAWSRVPDMLGARMSQKMKVAVTVDDISLSLNSIKIRDLEIGNPRGSILPKAFSAKEIAVNAPLMRYLSNNIVIDEIAIDQIYLGLEFESAKGTDGNWTTIMGNLESSTSPSPKEQKEGKADRTLLIKKLVLTNINTDVVYVKEGGKIRHLPRIDRMELYDLSSEGGFPVDQLMNSVLGQMLRQVFIQQNLNNMLQGLLQKAPDTVNKYLQPFKRFIPAVDKKEPSPLA